MNLSTALGRLRLAGLLEGWSFVVLLFIAMPLKYAAGQPEAVRVVGMAHGVLFLAYLAAILIAQVDLDAGHVLAEPAESLAHHVAHVARELLAARDVAVRLDLNVHVRPYLIVRKLCAQ